MTLPAQWHQTQVVATYMDARGRPKVGSVVFVPSQVLIIGGVTVMPASYEAQLDAFGTIGIRLPSTDDPALSQQGWYYTVIEQFEGGRRYEILVPSSPGLLDLATVAPIEDAVYLQTYAPGPSGQSATITVLPVVQLAAGAAATVTNKGTASAAQLEFGIPNTSLPAGGLQGTSLVKNSNADGDVGWAIPSPIDGGTFA